MNQTMMRRLISIGMLLVLIVLFTILAGAGKGKFLSFDNLIEIVRDASIPAIVGVGVTFVIITAGIDLSTGSAMALVGMVMANIYAYTLLPFPVMIAAGILTGVICGFVNGYIVAKLHVPEFIGTLATMSIYRALTYIIAIKDANGVIKSQPMNHSGYTWLGMGIGKFYYVIIAMIIIVAAGQIILKYTRYGTNLYSIGASKKAATLSGIDVAKTQMIAYIITGFSAGGVSVGALFMATLENGVRKLDMNTAFQYVIKGLIIVAVVIFDATYKARMDKKAREEGAKEGLE